MENSQYTKALQFLFNDSNKDHKFSVEFDGESYQTVVPGPLAEEFGRGFIDEGSAWVDIVMVRHLYPSSKQWPIEDPLRCAKALWGDLGNIPTDEMDDIELDWLFFDKGTDRQHIWHWFEETFDVSDATDLMCVA